jgi:hypothetical protein
MPRKSKVERADEDSPIPRYITRAQACAFFEINPRTMRDLIAQKIVVEGPARGSIDFQASAKGYVGRLREQASGRATSGGISLADARAAAGGPHRLPPAQEWRACRRSLRKLSTSSSSNTVRVGSHSRNKRARFCSVSPT